MNVLICGAGQVGSGIARQLASEENDVTIVDSDASLIQRIGDTLDVAAIHGDAAHPDVLERAGAADADMLIAATYSDEVNMLACAIAHALFAVPTKVARIRHQAYLADRWCHLFSRERLPIDIVISPEREVAKAMLRRLQAPGASETITLADGKVRLLGMKLTANCPIVNTPLRQLSALFPDLSVTVVGIRRGTHRFVPHGDDAMRIGDEVFVVADAAHAPRVMMAFGHEEPQARRVVVIGGGNVGLFLSQLVESELPAVGIKLIERDRERAEFVAGALRHGMVLHGDALEADTLFESNVAEAETCVAVTDNDHTNVLASLLAKRLGCARTIALVNHDTLAPLFDPLDIDVVVNPRAITVSQILQHVRRGRVRALHSIGDGFGEVLEAEALETSPIVQRPISELGLPGGAIVGAVVREGKVIVARGGTQVRAGDRVVAFAAAGVVKRVEKLLSVRLQYF